MGLLNSLVSRAFRDEQGGRVVVFQGDRRNRGYLVRSETEERKIRAFLKMFYSAHLAIWLLGILAANAWSVFFMDSDYAGHTTGHVVRSVGIFLAIYSVVVLLPYLLLWRSYQQARLSFVSVQDEVLVSGTSAGRRPRIAVAVVAFAVLILFGAIIFLTRSR